MIVNLVDFRQNSIPRHFLSSPKSRRSRAAKTPEESMDAWCRRSLLILFIRSVKLSLSFLRTVVSSSRSWIRYFWLTDRKLRSKIPVIAANWKKLCLFFFTFSKKPDATAVKAFAGSFPVRGSIGADEAIVCVKWGRELTTQKGFLNIWAFETQQAQPYKQH